MTAYLLNFAIYTMAMVGAILVCFIVYKKTLPGSRGAKNNNYLKIENALNLSQRKTLYVVKAGNEKFLIAADMERTSFLAKLDDNTNTATIPQNAAIQDKKEFTDLSELNFDFETKLTPKKKPAMMREIIRKLNIPQ